MDKENKEQLKTKFNKLLGKETPKQVAFRYLFMILGCACYALSLRMFLAPLKMVSGGVSGAGVLVETLTNGKIRAGYVIAGLNLPILLLGLKLMGWRFIVRCLITNGVLSLLTEVFALFVPTDLTENSLLAVLYAGILQGIGIGLFIKYEMSSGGTELLGRVTHHVVPFGSIAIHTAIFDGIIVILGAILLKKVENILYILILVFVSAKVSDVIVFSLDKAKLCYIITEKENIIADYLISTSPRGVTLIKGEGMYSKQPKGVLLTCVKPHQITSLKNAIKKLDENAFVIVCDANEVYGKGFHSI